MSKLIDNTNLYITDAQVEKGKIKKLEVNGNKIRLGDNLHLETKIVSVTDNGLSEVTPTIGYDGMRKVELDVNVSIHLYCWRTQTPPEGMSVNLFFYCNTETPSIGQRCLAYDQNYYDTLYYNENFIAAIADDYIEDVDGNKYYRFSSGDILV